MREMKDSGVEWIGKMPSTWNLCRIKDVCNVDRGGSPRPIDEYLTDDSDGYNWIKIGDTIKGSKFIDSTSQRIIESGLNKTRLVKSGTLLLTNSMSFGEPYILNIDGCIHDGWLAFSNYRGILKEYLYYYLISDLCSIQFKLQVAGGVVKNLNIDKVKVTYLLVPPIHEQKKIVTYLEDRCAKIDSIIMKQLAIIEKLKEYKLSIITEKVSNGLNPCVSTKYSGNEFIGSIPSHWKCVKIKNVSIVVTDGAHVSPETENGVYDFISTVNVEQDHIDFDNCLKTTESSYQYLVSTGCRPLSGDVLISKDGSVGRTAIVNTDRDFVVSSSLVIIRPKIEMITSEFLNYNLQSTFVQETLLMLMHGAGLRRVSVNKNANLPVLLPPIEEQKDIVKYLEKKCSEIEKDITKRRTIVEELFMYKKSIIFEVVTGKKEI